MAVPASPTPGKMTFSADFSSSGSSVMMDGIFNRSKAFFTDRMLPALYFTIAINVLFVKDPYNTPFVLGSNPLSSLLMAIFKARANALNIDSIL